jgi:hypothetical protein
MKENKEHKKHGMHPHHKHAAMPQFNEGHWEHKPSEAMMSDVKYTKGEMSNPEHLKQSVAALNGYVSKHKAQH